MLFIHEKEENFSICKNMNGSQGHHAKWNKPVIRRLTLHDSAYVRCLNSQTQKQKVEWWLPDTGERGMGIAVQWAIVPVIQDEKVLSDLLNNIVLRVNDTVLCI